ncbi:MAG: SDR family NAD(P)-dependent oxidoreductase [Caldilineaceae bacterium]
MGAAMSRALARRARRWSSPAGTAQAAEFAATLPGAGHLGLAFQQDDTDAIPAFVADVVARTGRIDVLVNAYGGTAPSIDTATAADFDRLPHRRDGLFSAGAGGLSPAGSRPGSIINIGSMYGVVASYPDAYTDLPVNSPPNYHGLKAASSILTPSVPCWAARTA